MSYENSIVADIEWYAEEEECDPNYPEYAKYRIHAEVYGRKASIAFVILPDASEDALITLVTKFQELFVLNTQQWISLNLEAENKSGKTKWLSN